jgi:hypothetical protein
MLNKHFEQTQNIHDELGREQALFDCLNIPKDEVKLTIVKCLFNVP